MNALRGTKVRGRKDQSIRNSVDSRLYAILLTIYALSNVIGTRTLLYYFLFLLFLFLTFYTYNFFPRNYNNKKIGTVNTTFCGFDSHSRKLNFHFLALVMRKGRRWAPPLTQCLQNSAESDKRKCYLPTLLFVWNSVKLKIESFFTVYKYDIIA